MTLTYFGRTINPTDLGSLSATTVTLTPPGSMLAGDLVLGMGLFRNEAGTVNWQVSDAGGQSWSNVGGQLIGFGCTLQRFACVFNGTWASNPIFDTQLGVADCISGLLLVFRPDAQGLGTWQLDHETYTFASDDTAPYDLVFTSQTVKENNELILVEWHRDVSHTMSLQTGGWSNPSSETQWRNLAGSDMTLSVGYKVQDAGSSGDVTNRASTGPAFFGSTYMSWYEYTQTHLRQFHIRTGRQAKAAR